MKRIIVAVVSVMGFMTILGVGTAYAWNNSTVSSSAAMPFSGNSDGGGNAVTGARVNDSSVKSPDIIQPLSNGWFSLNTRAGNNIQWKGSQSTHIVAVPGDNSVYVMAFNPKDGALQSSSTVAYDQTGNLKQIVFSKYLSGDGGNVDIKALNIEADPGVKLTAKISAAGESITVFNQQRPERMVTLSLQGGAEVKVLDLSNDGQIYFNQQNSEIRFTADGEINAKFQCANCGAK